MAVILKEIPVKDKEEAIRIIDGFSEKYQLSPTDPDNSLDISNEKFHIYYDAGKSLVIIETNDAHSVGEHLKELIADFPVFF
ncbi:MAG: hypothetical protein Q8926_09080 [Bacteroidota bacterium]|nr:hypothetical protein [Bacteroidota bacterium]